MERYFTELAGAFVRGRLRNQAATLEEGMQAGLRLHKFKAGTQLPRVQRVLGILRGMNPQRLLDVGSGRGAFLWPLLESFPELAVTAIEVSQQRAGDLAAVRRGGISRLTAAQMSAEQMGFAPGSFDVVTMLEVLEHMPNPRAALRCAISVARRFVLMSVPSVPDDNPEHLHLFNPEQLRDMAKEAGAVRTTIEHVLNHRIVIIRVQPGPQ
jgi:2-polyprenyl-3-methyl-5-hydroxy-6-metoxy-1,4-benzoquinol methylase